MIKKQHTNTQIKFYPSSIIFYTRLEMFNMCAHTLRCTLIGRAEQKHHERQVKCKNRINIRGRILSRGNNPCIVVIKGRQQLNTMTAFATLLKFQNNILTLVAR